MSETDHIPDRQQRILQRVAAGEGWREAAKKEGCSDSYSRVVGARMKRNPLIAKQLDEIREKGCKMAAYGLAEAMEEANGAAAFARANKNSMALVKACELRAKLSGLLIDRIEVVPVDLIGALQRAEARVINVTPLSFPSRGPIDWRPPVAGDPEVGPADGQVRS